LERTGTEAVLLRTLFNAPWDKEVKESLGAFIVIFPLISKPFGGIRVRRVFITISFSAAASLLL